MDKNGLGWCPMTGYYEHGNASLSCADGKDSLDWRAAVRF
jgi:hypothetical protein